MADHETYTEVCALRSTLIIAEKTRVASIHNTQ